MVRTWDAMPRTDDLERLYRGRYEDFLRVARSITRDDGAAHDAVQEAFARAIRSRQLFRGESSLDGWVWGIVLNVARSMRSTPAGRNRGGGAPSGTR